MILIYSCYGIHNSSLGHIFNYNCNFIENDTREVWFMEAIHNFLLIYGFKFCTEAVYC